jgi:hypothetical protein
MRDELFLYYKDCPDLIQFVDNIFLRYYDNITIQFTKQKRSIQHQSDYVWVQYDKCLFLCCLEIFPLRDELLYHSTSSREETSILESDSLSSSSSTSSVHMGAIAVIIKIQHFIACCHQEFERIDSRNRLSRNNAEDEKELVKRKYIRGLVGELLHKINVSLKLLQNTDYSRLKKELIVEYLKGVLNFIRSK